MKIAIFASALALTLVRPALADPWLFYDFTERSSFIIPDQPVDSLASSPYLDTLYYYTSSASADILGTQSTGLVDFYFYGGDTWGVSYTPTGAYNNQVGGLDWQGYLLSSGHKVTASYGPVFDFTYVPWDPATADSFHATDVTICDMTTPGCSVAAIDAAPEPSVWALMLAGVAMVGATLRLGRRRTVSSLA